MKKKVIITGATGMVGRGVLLECLADSRIVEVLLVNRSPISMTHPKLKELLLADFTKVDTLQYDLKGYDACFYCMGVSAIGLDESVYNHITYDTTKAFVDTLYMLNPKAVFNYVSGKGTDSTEQGRVMWARVKGKTENEVLGKGFGDAYAFRPGAILPEKGITSKTAWYNVLYMLLRPFFPLMKRSSNITTTTRVGLAMINTLFYQQDKKILHNPEINLLGIKGVQHKR